MCAAFQQCPRADPANWVKGKRKHTLSRPPGSRPRSSSLFGVSLKSFTLTWGDEGSRLSSVIRPLDKHAKIGILIAVVAPRGEQEKEFSVFAWRGSAS